MPTEKRTLDELIARLEELGPNFALEQEINLAIFGQEASLPPSYTTSIDAALRLVPDGYYWIVGHGRNNPIEPLGGAIIIDPATDCEIAEAQGDSVAIAVCIAALKARVFVANETGAA